MLTHQQQERRGPSDTCRETTYNILESKRGRHKHANDKGASRIEMEYEHSTMEEWNVPCPSCGELQPLEWSNLIYKVDADGEIESTTYVCAKCGVVHTEVEWKEHFNEGRYVAKYPNRKVRGFHFNSLASTFLVGIRL